MYFHGARNRSNCAHLVSLAACQARTCWHEKCKCYGIGCRDPA
jgi:hypothetical protein